MAWGSRPTSGSSKMMTFGLCTSWQQMDNFCCMPLESSLPSLSRLSHISKRLSSASPQPSSSMRQARRMNSRCSETVKRSYTAGISGM